MPMRIDDKKVAVEELQEVANKAVSAVAADYHGTSVSELTALRKEASCLLYTSPSPRDS